MHEDDYHKKQRANGQAQYKGHHDMDDPNSHEPLLDDNDDYEGQLEQQSEDELIAYQKQ